MLTSAEITNLISKVNKDSTIDAVQLYDANYNPGKITPIIKSLGKFISLLFKIEKRFTFKEKIVNICLFSFQTILTYLKLLKLNKRF